MAEIFSGPGQIQGPATPQGLTRVNRYGRDLTFSEVLKARLEREIGIKFSAHAVERLRERDVTLKGDDIDRLATAFAKAEEKGVSDSLILLDNVAFIVSIRNNTVVTVMLGDNIKESVFTNIDSAVIA